MRSPTIISLSQVLVSCLVISGCARVDSRLDSPFSPTVEVQAQDLPEPPPSLPTRSVPPPSDDEDDQAAPPEQSTLDCPDPDPRVIAACLEAISSVTVVGDSVAVLAAERDTGVIKEVRPDAKATIVGRVPVDPRFGGLLNLVGSPTYQEDGLIFALIGAPGGVKVMKIARGDVAKPASGTIPTSRVVTRAAMVFIDSELYVGVDRSVMRFSDFSGIGKRDKVVQIARTSAPITTMCLSPTSSEMIIATHSLLSAVSLFVFDSDSESLASISGFDEPHMVTSCAVTADQRVESGELEVAVTIPDHEAIHSLRVEGDAVVRNRQFEEVTKEFGRLDALTMVTAGVLVAGTANKPTVSVPGGQPFASNDRVIVLPAGGGSGGAGID